MASSVASGRRLISAAVGSAAVGGDPVGSLASGTRSRALTGAERCARYNAQYADSTRTSTPAALDRQLPDINAHSARTDDTDCTSPSPDAALCLEESGAYVGLRRPAPGPRLLALRRAPARGASRARDGGRAGRADAGWTAAAMREFLAGHDLAADAALAAALRELRARVLLRVAARDLAGLAPLAEVVGTMSDLAEVALEAAHRHHRARLEAEHGSPAGGSDLLIVGMGKLGGRELNVSSDIDLVFVYPEEGDTAGPRALSNHEFFVRLGQRIIRTLADVTPDGQVFRVDMRLRPWGDSGPLATSFDALEQYFVAHGREWERYAWIKSRVVAGGDPADDRRARAHRAAVRVPEIPRLRQHRRGAPAARADPRRGRAPRRRRRREARPGRHPGDRVHRPVVPAHPRRPRSGSAGAGDADGARDAGGEAAVGAGRGRRARGGVRLPAAARAPAAVSRGPADPPAARRPRRTGA